MKLLPDIPNDPAHPLRPFVFRWVRQSHLDGKTWFGETYRDEFHRVTKIDRAPRRRSAKKHNRPMGVRYRFDGEQDEVDYETLVERLRRQHGPPVGQVQHHPLVEAWREGRELDFTPSDPAYAVGSRVRRTFAELSEDLRQRLLDKHKGRAGVVQKGNALYLLVDWAGKTGAQWVPAWKLALVEEHPSETVTPSAP